MEKIEPKTKLKSKVYYKDELVNVDTTANIDKIKNNMKKGFSKYLIYIILVLIVGLGLSTAYFYKKSVDLNNPNAVSEKEAKSLTQKVGKLVVLPTDEIPTVATVSDPEALKGQEFFTNAKKGDKVLIYSNAKKAILYDPKINKIITIAPLNIEEKEENN